MARLVIELTNRCNLRCQHCFDERHAATGDLPLEIIEKVLEEGKGCGIDHLSFTGGEPTIHRRFPEIIRRVCDAGYAFSFVSNGTNFPHIYPLLMRHGQWFAGVTFSLDGAREQTHNRLRGKASYRSVMQAASICVFKDLPFTFNMVLTAQNRHEISEMVSLAKSLGSRGVRFGHPMPTPETACEASIFLPRNGARWKRKSGDCKKAPTCRWAWPPDITANRPSSVCAARAQGVQSRLPRKFDPLLPAFRLCRRQ